MSYMGIPALYENKRFKALSYAALNLSLYKMKNHFDPRAHRSRYDFDTTLYPNRSTPTTFFRSRAGVSPQLLRDDSLFRGPNKKSCVGFVLDLGYG